MKTKEFIVAVIFIITSLVAHNFFPANGVFQQVITTLVFFVMLPLLFNKFFLKKHFKDVNIGVGEYKLGIILSVLSLLIISFIFFISSYYFDFLKQYAVPNIVVGNFIKFLFYEFILVLPFVVIYEFYFRGFVMPIFEKKIGQWAILAQAILFLILVLSNGGGTMYSFAPYLVVAPFAGVIAYKSRSILYSGAAQFLVLFVLNLLVIKKIG